MYIFFLPSPPSPFLLPIFSWELLAAWVKWKTDSSLPFFLREMNPRRAEGKMVGVFGEFSCFACHSLIWMSGNAKSMCYLSKRMLPNIWARISYLDHQNRNKMLWVQVVQNH